METSRILYPIRLYKPVPVGMLIAEEGTVMIGYMDLNVIAYHNHFEIPVLTQEDTGILDNIETAPTRLPVTRTVCFKIFFMQLSETCRILALEYLYGMIDEIKEFRRF